MVEEISIDHRCKSSDSFTPYVDRKKELKSKKQQAPVVSEDALTMHQKESLIKFKELVVSSGEREKMRDEEFDDKACLRWLKARKYNANKAVEMLKNYNQWKADEKVDDMCMEICQSSLDMDTVCYMGEDRNKRPTFVITPAKHAPHSIPIDQIQALMVLTLEIAIRNLKPDCEHFVVIFDYEGWCLRHVDKNVDNCIMSIGQNNYPERLKEAILVQPPWYFTTVWSVVKLFLDDATRSKVTFLKAKVSEEMLKRFTPENLLEKYGGSAKGMSMRQYLNTQLLHEKETLGQYIERKASRSEM